MRFSVVLLFFLGSSMAMVQTTNTWKTLAKVDYKTRFDELTQFEEEYPIFSEEVKALDGTEITLQGWMIPLDELRGENYFVLSSLPFANCFFCGGAGPETVMEVFSKKQIDFTEKKIKVKGKLKINADDPLRLMYILNDAKLID